MGKKSNRNSTHSDEEREEEGESFQPPSRASRTTNRRNISEITKGIFMPLCQLIAVLRESELRPEKPKWMCV